MFGAPQAIDPSKRMLPMAQVYTIPGIQSMPVKMEAIPTTNKCVHMCVFACAYVCICVCAYVCVYVCVLVSVYNYL